MIKLINIDLDNTLLFKHHYISQENLDAIKYAMDKGVLVGMNTGRNAVSARIYNKEIGFNAPYICCNGTIVMDNKDNVLYESILEEKYFERCIKISKETGVPFHAFGAFEFFLVGENYQDDVVNSWGQKAIEKVRAGMVYIDSYEEFMKVKKSITKISFSTMNMEEFETIKKCCESYDDWQVTFALGKIVEINNKFDNKGIGMAHLCDMYDISLKDVACIGDDTNDFAMFRHAGVRVAMGNAVEKLKENADIITDTCENSGVAKAIYDLVK